MGSVTNETLVTDGGGFTFELHENKGSGTIGIVPEQAANFYAFVAPRVSKVRTITLRMC